MKKWGVFFLAVAALAVTLWGQEAQAPATRPQQPPTPPQPADVSYARLSVLSGQAFIQRAADLGSEEATANMPVAEGDRLGTTSGRAEIYVAKRTYVRLDKNTKVDFAVLPKAGNPLVRLRQWAGNVYLDVAKLEKEKSVEVMTSDATFYVLTEGLYRIDVKETAQTEVLVFEGLVEASGEDGSMLVKKNQRLTIVHGRFDGRPLSFFAAADDAFDRWNQDRVSLVRRQFASRRLPDELQDFEGELETAGEWRSTDEFGAVWVPNDLEPGWRPYSWGRWTWMPSGWCWIPYEPWGWATFHYGFWHWGVGLGWYWIPYHVWGPAWVSWWWDPWYYGWAPLSWWGYPGVLINNVYYGRGWNGDYPYNSRALTVVRKDQLQAPDIRKAALSPEAIRSVGKMNLNRSTLAVKPSPNPGVRVESLEGGRQVILRKNGEGGPVSTAGARPESAAGSSRVARPSERQGEPASAPRRIEPRRTGEAALPSGTGTVGGRTIRRSGAASGYPSSAQITRENALQGSRNLRPSSTFNRALRYFGGSSSGLRISPFRLPAPASRSRSFSASPPRTMPRSFSSPPSARPPSSSGRSSGSSGGNIRKK
jgi:hypothetical protein